MNSVRLNRNDLTVLQAVKGPRFRSPHQIANDTGMAIQSVYTSLGKLGRSGLVDTWKHSKEGGFYDGSMAIFYRAFGLSQNRIDMLTAMADLDAYLSSNVASFYRWMRSKFGRGRARQLFVQSGIWKNPNHYRLQNAKG